MRTRMLGTMLVVVTAGCAAAAGEDADEASDAFSAGRDAGVVGADSGRDSGRDPQMDASALGKCGGEIDYVEDLTGSVAASAIAPGLALTPDEKTIYFGFDSAPGLVHAERASSSGAFGEAVRPTVGTTEPVTYPALAPDGHTLFATIGTGSTSRIARADLFAQTGFLAFETVRADAPIATPFVDPKTGALYVSRTDGQRTIGTLEDGKLVPTASLRTAPIWLPTSSPVLSSDGGRIFLTLWTGLNGPPADHRDRDARDAVVALDEAHRARRARFPDGDPGVDLAGRLPPLLHGEAGHRGLEGPRRNDEALTPDASSRPRAP